MNIEKIEKKLAVERKSRWAKNEEIEEKEESRQDRGNEEAMKKMRRVKRIESAVRDNMRSGEKDKEEKIKKMLFEWKQDFAR